MFPRRAVTLTLLALAALAPALPADAATKRKARAVKGHAVPCLASDGTTVAFRERPRACTIADEFTAERSLIPVRSVRWTSWTAKRAKGTGTIKGDGFSGKVTLTGTAPKRCSRKLTIYTQLTVAIPHKGAIGALTAACPS